MTQPFLLRGVEALFLAGVGIFNSESRSLGTARTGLEGMMDAIIKNQKTLERLDSLLMTFDVIFRGALI